MKKTSVVEQLRQNTVALISLVIAITSLGYNTWRNEHSERNRNLRFASFELLSKLGELEDLLFVNFFDCDKDSRGSPRTGWTLVRTIGDLAHILDDDGMPQNIELLKSAWADNWEAIEFASSVQCVAMRDSVEAGTKTAWSARAGRVFEIRDAIDVVRKDAREVLYALE